jgi:transposase InsO family protein
LLRREGLYVKHKRVYRLYHLKGLSVKYRQCRKGLVTERLPLLRPAAPNLTWSMDFVMDALANERRITGLTCVDVFTKECLVVTVACGILGVQVTRILDSIVLFHVGIAGVGIVQILQCGDYCSTIIKGTNYNLNTDDLPDVFLVLILSYFAILNPCGCRR